MSWRAVLGGVWRTETRHQCELARVTVAGCDLWLIKPTTYMNRSGGRRALDRRLLSNRTCRDPGGAR